VRSVASTQRNSFLYGMSNINALHFPLLASEVFFK
jgi:hypothetical protein